MSATIQVTGLGNYLEEFSSLQQRTARQPQWLRAQREHAFGSFCDQGFPTTRDEDWRFTSVASIANTAFQIAQPASTNIPSRDLQPYALEDAACRLVFVNGRFAAELSQLEHLPAGLVVSSLGASLLDEPGIAEDRFGLSGDAARDAFSSLNAAFFEDGAYIQISPGTVITAPLQLLFLSTSSGRPQVTHPRNLIVVGNHAQISIVEEHVSLDEEVSFTNEITDIVAGENSTVSHLLIERQNLQSFHVSTLRIRQERNSNVRSHSVLLGGSLVRNNVQPVLAGEGAECLINGLFLGSGKQHMDNHMMVEHASPHCASHQFYNGILGGHAHGVFHGRILVQKDAQKTDAKQTNRNLLLSDDAQIDTKPQLEIYADDVKCTHGATIGQIDENALFYLRSRGLDETSARDLLLLAFAGECLQRIDAEAVRKYVERLVRRSLQKLRSFSFEDDERS